MFWLKIFAGFLVGAWLLLFWYLRNPVFSYGQKIDAADVSPEVLEASVRALTGIVPPRQFENASSMLAAEKYVETEFQKLGYVVTKQDVFAHEKNYHNLVVRYGDANAKEIIVVGAHYDVCGNQSGADDNASGVAGIIELARLLQKNQPKLKFPVELVVYSLEEPPFFGGRDMGSAIHADLLSEGGVSVRCMVSLEMIGYFSHAAFSQHFDPPIMHLWYPWTGDFIGIVGTPADRELVKSFKAAMIPNSSIPVYSINAPRVMPGVDFSDHRNYWDHNWPAVMITDTAFFRNEQYHASGDTPDRLDYKSMAQVIQGVYAAIADPIFNGR